MGFIREPEDSPYFLVLHAPLWLHNTFFASWCRLVQNATECGYNAQKWYRKLFPDLWKLWQIYIRAKYYRKNFSESNAA